MCVCSRLCVSAHVKGSECSRLFACSHLFESFESFKSFKSFECGGLADFIRLLTNARVGRLILRMLASVCVCLASVCVCLASVCVCLRMLASVVLSCECLRLCASVSRLCASVCVCLASVCVCLRMLASVVLSCECLRLCASVSRRSSCLAYVCVCLRELAHFMRLASFKEFKGGGELAQVFAICLASYYPLAVFCERVLFFFFFFDFNLKK